MMTRGTGQPVALTAANKRCIGEVRVEHWGNSARLIRAAKSWAVLWGLAVVSILIPVAHFLLVPGFLVAGPINAVLRYRQKSGVLTGEGPCPSCGAPFTVEARADSWPFYEPCQACHTEVRVEKLGAGAPEAEPIRGGG
jgi:hypothetical protein